MFSLEIKTGNAAFCSPTTGEPNQIFEAQEVASILRYVADKIDDGYGESRSGSCIDANGNNVGSWKFQYKAGGEMRKGVRIEDAAYQWVSSFNAYPENMIRMVIEASHYTEFNEVTPPGNGDRVYLLERDEYGHIESHEDDMFEIETDSGDTVRISGDQLDVERDGDLPMWGTLWGFGDSADDYWLEELGGLQIMSDLGFRIYESEEFGYIFGIDGCGYSFYEAHWIPLCKARGLQWHDPDADKPEPLVKITCYGQIEELTREDAIKKYLDGVRCCEGA